MGYRRQDVRDTSPLSIKAIQDNFTYLWKKVFGDINETDLDTVVKTKLHTNYIQIQGENNLDSSHPVFIRFFVPPNTNKVGKAVINVITSKYRTDSAIQTAEGAVNLVETDEVKKWALDPYNQETWIEPPTAPADPTQDYGGDWSQWFPAPQYISTADSNYATNTPVPANMGYLIQALYEAGLTHIVDYYYMQHKHKVSLNVPAHTHSQQDGIRESTEIPSDVNISINGQTVGIPMNGVDTEQNNISISAYVSIGKWNVLKVTSSNPARVTVYGYAELVENY